MCGHNSDGNKKSCHCPGFKVERFMQPCLLLLLYEKPSHGYELMERLSDFGFNECIDPGAIYRNLRKMEEEGLIKSEWDTQGKGPAKRLYELTEEGKEALYTWAEHVKRQIKRMEYFLKRYDETFKEGE
ncbi:MAG: helix-turn-helix transcriptional regulator [Thermovenabulum sp.]|uniref:helix-turn-helix transcriptional regulator n=1 Tax=Thermovenabulum sp. TaxID=3100335 RepID=UPI003C7E8C71